MPENVGEGYNSNLGGFSTKGNGVAVDGFGDVGLGSPLVLGRDDLLQIGSLFQPQPHIQRPILLLNSIR